MGISTCVMSSDPSAPSDEVTVSKTKIVEDFFYDNPNLPGQPLPEHTLEESPCSPIIEIDKDRYVYYCKLHGVTPYLYLEAIEHHSKIMKQIGIRKEYCN